MHCRLPERDRTNAVYNVCVCVCVCVCERERETIFLSMKNT